MIQDITMFGKRKNVMLAKILIFQYYNGQGLAHKHKKIRPKDRIILKSIPLHLA